MSRKVQRRISMLFMLLTLVFILIALQQANAQTEQQIREANQKVEVAMIKNKYATRAVYTSMAALVFCPPSPACIAPVSAIIGTTGYMRVTQIELRHARENQRALWPRSGGGGTSGGR